MHSLRLAAAALLLASVVGATVVSRDRGGRSEDQVVATTTTTVAGLTTTSAAPPVTIGPTPTVPAATTVPPAPPATLPAPATGEAKALVTGTGVVVPVIGREGAGFRVGTPCGGETVIGGGQPIPSAAVVLDAGHGGVEPGAIGPGGLTEKVLNLEVAKAAKATLEQAGIATVLTRTADYRITLGARARIVQTLKPRAFVSIHHNAEPDGPSPKPGTETYQQIASADSKRLSGLIYEEVVAALSAYRVAWVADTDAGAKYRVNSRGGDYYGIIRQTAGVPSVLAELGFISNAPEEALYAQPEVQRVEGAAVARGILRYLTTKDPGSGFTVPYDRSSPAGPGGGGSSCVDPPL